MNSRNHLLCSIALLVVSCLLTSGRPVTTAAKKSAKTYLEKLQTDIHLTDSQKTVISTIAAEYYTSISESNSVTDKQKKFALKKQSNLALKSKLDSLLSAEQRELLKQKVEVRKRTLMNANNK